MQSLVQDLGGGSPLVQRKALQAILRMSQSADTVASLLDPTLVDAVISHKAESNDDHGMGVRAVANLLLQETARAVPLLTGRHADRLLVKMQSRWRPAICMATFRVLFLATMQPASPLRAHFADPGEPQQQPLLLAILKAIDNPAGEWDAAVAEALKVAYNLTDPPEPWVGLVAPLLRICSRPDATLQPPVQQAIAVLLNLPAETIMQCGEVPDAPASLVRLLAACVAACSEELPNEEMCPLVLLLLRLVQADDATRKLVFDAFFAAPIDRTRPLTQDPGIRGKAVRLQTSISSPLLKSALSELLFEACGKDQARFVENVGLGTAAGLLSSKGLMAGTIGGGSGDAGGTEPAIDPVTGAYCDAAPDAAADDMTEEEREAESARLMDLFDRLNRNGIIKVKF